MPDAGIVGGKKRSSVFNGLGDALGVPKGGRSRAEAFFEGFDGPVFFFRGGAVVFLESVVYPACFVLFG